LSNEPAFEPRRTAVVVRCGSPATRRCTLSNTNGVSAFHREWCAEDGQCLWRRNECSDPAFEEKPVCWAFGLGGERSHKAASGCGQLCAGRSRTARVGERISRRRSRGANLVPGHARKRPDESVRRRQKSPSACPFFQSSAGMRAIVAVSSGHLTQRQAAMAPERPITAIRNDLNATLFAIQAQVRLLKKYLPLCPSRPLLTRARSSLPRDAAARILSRLAASGLMRGKFV
jgi:hypothetical protein